MKKGFQAMPGVDGWQLSNPSIISAAAHLAALQLFDEAGIKNLRDKSVLLTGYLAFLIEEIDPDKKIVKLLTPRDPAQRGCQLSLFVEKHGRKIFNHLIRSGVVADWREPNVIRLAPVPLYNTFEEVFRFGEIFAEAIEAA